MSKQQSHQVWAGLWEYLRLALPCVAMMAVEWWAFVTWKKVEEFHWWKEQPKHSFYW